MIAIKISTIFGINEDVQYLISGLIAAITISGKAAGKEIAKNKSTIIVHFVGTLLNKFHKEEK